MKDITVKRAYLFALQNSHTLLRHDLIRSMVWLESMKHFASLHPKVKKLYGQTMKEFRRTLKHAQLFAEGNVA